MKRLIEKRSGMVFHFRTRILEISAACSILFGAACSFQSPTTSRTKSTSSADLPTIVGSVPIAVEASPRGYAQASVDFNVLPAGNGFQPKLAIVYSSSQSGQGLAGVGWELTGLSSITRCPKHANFEGSFANIALDDSDSLCLDGKKLLLTEGSNFGSEAVYRLYLDEFKKAIRSRDHFIVKTRSGETWTYGESSASREKSSGVDISWQLSKIQDRSGNQIDFEYFEDGHRLYLKKVSYGGNGVFNKPANRFLTLEYDQLETGVEKFSAGQSFVSRKLLKTVSAGSLIDTIWTYHLDYETRGQSGLRVLKAMKQCFRNNACLPQTALSYEGGDAPGLKEADSYKLLEFAPLKNPVWAPEKAARVFSDLNNDGRTDILGIRRDGIAFSLAGTEGMGTVVESSRKYPFVWDPRFDMASLNDINRDGFPDIVLFSQDSLNGGVYVAYWTSEGYGEFVKWTEKFGKKWSVRDHFRMVTDVNGDGWPDIIGIRDDGVYLTTNEKGVLAGGEAPVLADFGLNAGWNRERHPRYFADVNGDGLIDIIGFWKSDVRVSLGTGRGFLPPKIWLNGFGHDRYYSSDNLPRMLADMNGDGLTDLVGFHLDGVYVALNTGRAFKAEERWLDGLYFSRGWSGQANTRRMIFDFNKDGFPDFVGFRFNGLEVYYGRGAPVIGQAAAVFPKFSSKLVPWKSAEDEIQLEDLDSNANMELISLLRQGAWSTEINARPIRLTEVRDGLGNQTKILYGLLSDHNIHRKTIDFKPPLMSVAGVMPVVKEIQKSNGIGGFTSVGYQYANGAFHTDGFGFLGFESRTITDRATHHTTVERYSLDTDKMTHGSLVSVAVYEGNNVSAPLSKTESAYTTRCFNDHRLHCVVGERQSISQFYDESFAPLYSVKIDKEYDEYQNVKSMVTTISDRYGDYTTRITSSFANDEANWNIGLLEKVETTQLATSKDLSIPTPKAVQKSVAFTYDSSGRLVTETQEPDSSLWMKKTYGRLQNQYGMVDSIVTNWAPDHGKGLGFTEVWTTIAHDEQGFPEKTFNALQHTVTEIRDPDTGVIKESFDSNGLKTVMTHDAALRVATITDPEDRTVITERLFCDSSCPPHAVALEKTFTKGFGESVNYVDSLGRTLRTVKSLIGEKKVAQDFSYDERGLLVKTSKAYFLDEGPKYWTIISYDSRQRKTSVLLPDEALIETRYNGLQTTQIDALKRATIQESDSRGLPLRITNSKLETIRYNYDAAGRLVQILDAGKNSTLMEYDAYGRRVFLADPTTGLTETSYNAVGKPFLEVRGNSRKEFTYDKLGRVLTQTISKTGVDSIRESYVYDAADHGIGKVKEVTGPDHKIVYTYDELSRPTETTETVLGKTYTNSTVYDSLGRTSRVNYPDGFAVTYSYDTVSHLTDIKDAVSGKSYWQLQEISANGNVRKAKFGNGAQMLRYEDDRNDRIESETVLGADNTLQMARTYQHDAVGNLLFRQDTTTGNGESFSYDALHRLESFSAASGSLVRLTYDALGRITSRSDIGDYEYGKGCEGGVSSPFAVKKVGSKSFCTDAFGNFIRAGDREITYDARNMPLVIGKGADSVRYKYGIGRAILSKEEVKQGEKTTTIYVGESFEIETSADRTRTKRNVGDFLVVESDGSDLDEVYLYKDYLGSTLAAANSNGQVIEKYDYDPFGQRRNASTFAWLDGFRPTTTSRGFTGHDHADTVNLIHMKGRMYDPTVGLFLSPDPFVQDPTLTTNLNRYAYVLNNPLSYTDPSGHFFKSILGAFKTAFDVVSRIVSLPFQVVDSALRRASHWVAKAENQRLIAAIAINVAGTILMGPQYLAITGWQQMAAYSAAVGYTSSYVASNGNQKAALNGAITGAAFSLVGSAFQVANGQTLSSGMSVGKVAAHGAVGGLASVANGGRFDSGFLSAGLSEFAGQRGLYGNAGGRGWEIASGAARAAIVGGSVSELSGGSFESGALNAAMGRLFNGVAHAIRGYITTGFTVGGAAVGAVLGGLGGGAAAGVVSGGTLAIPGAGYGAAQGAAYGSAIGYVAANVTLIAADVVENWMMSDKTDSELSGTKAPGVPTIEDGFTPAKKWDGESKVRSENGRGYGYPAKDGSVWVPTGEGPLAHGGPHWDVQLPNGKHKNVYPGGKIR